MTSLVSTHDEPTSDEEPSAAREEPELLAPPERVLATMNQDGTRRWLRPRPSAGRFLSGRQALAWVLMAIFVVVPWIHVGGKPLILLDIMRREFTLFGKTFLATDTPLLMVLCLGIGIAVFLVTALFGRVWCGWACPQTVYMEFLFRPLERLFEGSYQQQQKLDREGGGLRRIAKNVTFVLIAAFLAHTFLAFFVGWRQLLLWMQGSPLQHPTAFAVMAGTTLVMVLDFLWFREQTCLVACPYGRFQSVMFDRDTLIVGYDATRGEPRGKPKKKKKLPLASDAPGDTGDCIACGACVTTCPTGIDIRDGLQMECIGCAQCIDACDAIMDRVGRPRGLIRYCSERTLEGETRRMVRPRIVIYTVIILVLAGVLLFGLGARKASRVTALRGIGAPFVELPSGEINNQVRLKVRNQSRTRRSYAIALEAPQGVVLVAPENPLVVEGGAMRTTSVFVRVPQGAFGPDGRLRVSFRVSEGEDAFQVPYVLHGPGGTR